MTTGTTLFCRSAQHLQKSVFEWATCLQEHDRGCHTKVLSRVHFSPAIKLASAGLRVYVSSMLTNLGSTDCSTACFGAMADRKMFKAACTGSLCLGQRPLYAWTTLSMTCRHCCSTASSTVSSSASTLARATSSATCIAKDMLLHQSLRQADRCCSQNPVLQGACQTQNSTRNSAWISSSVQNFIAYMKGRYGSSCRLHQSRTNHNDSDHCIVLQSDDVRTIGRWFALAMLDQLLVTAHLIAVFVINDVS